MFLSGKQAGETGQIARKNEVSHIHILTYYMITIRGKVIKRDFF